VRGSLKKISILSADATGSHSSTGIGASEQETCCNYIRDELEIPPLWFTAPWPVHRPKSRREIYLP